MKNNFYVYALYYPNGDIFYVGKGKGRRIDVSARLPKKLNKGNYLKFKALKEIYSIGNEPIKKKLLENVSEEDALEFEEGLIKKYGRLCDGSGILTNIIKSSVLGNTGWIPSTETRNIWKKQRAGVKQTTTHINKRVSKIIGKTRSKRQKYNCIVAKLKGSPVLKTCYLDIIKLFDNGKFIESIYNITGINKSIISKIIKYRDLYFYAIHEYDFNDDLYNSKLKYSCQKISHILKDKLFYKEILNYIDNMSINEICKIMNTNATRIRFVIKYKNDIKDIIEKYE